MRKGCQRAACTPAVLGGVASGCKATPVTRSRLKKECLCLWCKNCPWEDPWGHPIAPEEPSPRKEACSGCCQHPPGGPPPAAAVPSIHLPHHRTLPASVWDRAALHVPQRQWGRNATPRSLGGAARGTQSLCHIRTPHMHTPRHNRTHSQVPRGTHPAHSDPCACTHMCSHSPPPSPVASEALSSRSPRGNSHTRPSSTADARAPRLCHGL